MAEYIERDALMKFPIRIDHYDKEHGNLDFVLGIESVLEYAEYIPAADVVEVVRCKDCRIGRRSYTFGDGWVFCSNNQMTHKEDHFCSYGERKGADDGHGI